MAKRRFYISAKGLAHRMSCMAQQMLLAKTVETESGFRLKFSNGQKFTVLVIEEKLSDNAFYGVKVDGK